MNEQLPSSISVLGDSAILISFGNNINEHVNKRVLNLFNKLKQSEIEGIRDVVPAYATLAIHFDPLCDIFKSGTAVEFYSNQISQLNVEDTSTDGATRRLNIPVCYASKYGPDLNNISLEKKLSPQEIIHIHTERLYRVYMIGFIPGFAYMGEVDERIVMPRLRQPRLRVEAGSVGIAERQTGIYPLDSPGGWQIIGRSPVTFFNKDADEPVFFRPGDDVQFYSITEDEFENYSR